MLEKRKQRRCSSHGDKCRCPYWFIVKRQRMSTGVQGQTVAVPGGRIRVSLEKYFPGTKLRGKGTLSHAETLHNQFVADVDLNGRYRDWADHRQGRLVTRGLTWGGLVDHYVKTHAEPKREAEGRTLSRALRYRYDKIKAWVGPDKPISDLGLQDALNVLTALRHRKAGKAYIRSYYGSFLAIINKAVEWEILPRPPFNSRADVIREQVPKASDIEHRDRRLQPGEEESLFNCLDTPRARGQRFQLVRDCMRFSLSLGWRRGTLRRLQFEDLHWDEGPNGTLRVPGSKMKGRRASIKALTPATRVIVERRREMFVRLGVYGPECHLFGKTTRQGNKGKAVVLGSAYNENDFLTAAWNDARESAGISGLHFHDLRAEAACRLYEKTNDTRRVMHFLDHRSLEETQKYIDRLIAATEQENAEIMATFERSAPNGNAPVPAATDHTQRTTAGTTVRPFPSKRP